MITEFHYKTKGHGKLGKRIKVVGNKKDIYKEFLSYGPKGYIGINSDVIGHNYVPLFQDPEMTLGIGCFSVTSSIFILSSNFCTLIWGGSVFCST